jgi:hypothetical protein
MLYEWNRARYHDYDLSDRRFWQIFGPEAVPGCSCGGPSPIIGTIVKLRPKANGHKNGNGAFRLHYGPMSAPVYSRLRGRLSVMLFRQTGNVCVLDMDLDALAVMAGHGTRSVLKRLAAFEETLHRRSRVPLH